MAQEAANELVGGEAHHTMGVAVPIVLPAETDSAVVDCEKAAVRDGDAMGVPPDISEHLLRPGERLLRVDHPLRPARRRQVAQERGPLLELLQAGEEPQLAGGERLLQLVQEKAAEQPGQHPDRQEEAWAAGDPFAAVGRDAAAGYEAMQVRVVM